jgi:hypothetical protein
MMDSETDRLVRALADRVLRLAAVLERIQPDLAGLRGTFEGVVVHEIRMALSQIRESMGIVASNTKDAEQAANDAKAEAKATRAVTGSLKAHDPGDSGAIDRSIDSAGRVKPLTWLSMGGALLLAGVGVGAAIAVFRWLTSVLGTH